MGRNKTKKSDSVVIDVIAFIILIPLLILKLIGDIVVSFGKFFLIFQLKSYKFFCWAIKYGSNIIKVVVKKIRMKKKLRVFPPKRCEIIYRSKTNLNEFVKSILVRSIDTISSLRLPSLKFPKPKRLPTSIKLLIIKIKYFLLGAFIVGTGAFVYQVRNIIISLPNPAYLSFRDIPTTTKIYDRFGKLLYEIYAEENRTPVKLKDVPDIVIKATIAIEDKEFFAHKGFSLKGISRAIIHNLTTDTLEGGSTITQQLVRSALLTPEKTWQRKLKELALSIWTERLYSKDQILEMYLNQVPYGGTAWGIEAAAETYFNKKVKDLTLPQAALLAGLPAAPTLYSPFGAHPELAKLRQIEVLEKMAKAGFISKKGEDEARNYTLSYRSARIPIVAPHFVMYVKELLEQQFGPRMVEKGGLRVVTTLDLTLQEMAQRVVASEIGTLKSLQVGNGAALITNPNTGEILSMIGSADYFDREKEGNVNVTTSLRQPGSSIKVVTYSAALQKGYTATSILDDSPISYKVVGQSAYSPLNYDGKFHGRIPLRVALASSYNVPAVKVLSNIGIKQMIEQGKLMGITTWNEEDRFGLSLTLGGGEVTMLDMAKVYGSLAAYGKRVDLTPIVRITNWKGEILSLPTTYKYIQAVPPSIAFILSNILSDNNARTPAFGSHSSLVIPGKTVAVKTGTSDNKRDNWTIGYTPDYVVVVWVGNNNNRPMHPSLTSGVTGAAPIWNEIMTNLLADKEDKSFIPPPEVLEMPCYGRKEYFIRGTEPRGGCPKLPTATPTPTNQ